MEREIVNGYLVDKIFFPKCKIATVGELCVVLNNLLSYHGIRVEIKEHPCSVRFTSLSKVEIVEMPVKVASILDLLRDDGSVAKFSSDSNVPVTFELFQSEQRLRLTKSVGFNDYNRFIWNSISEHLFQMLVVGFDIMKPTFTGTEMSRTLCTMAVNPLNPILHYKPKTVKWKRVEPGLKSRINLYFSDTTGRPFNDILLSLLLKIRKPVLA